MLLVGLLSSPMLEDFPVAFLGLLNEKKKKNNKRLVPNSYFPFYYPIIGAIFHFEMRYMSFLLKK